VGHLDSVAASWMEARSPRQLQLDRSWRCSALLIWSLWWRRSVAAVNAPSYLMTQGPYAITRNPLYVAYLGLWLGWAGFFGSIGVFVGWLILCMVAGFVIVPKEERMLREQFAQAYTIYEMRVPRWVGRVKPSITRS
jgi:protein-S-isoprenylcysteine O-methyltransferase Ste14